MTIWKYYLVTDGEVFAVKRRCVSDTSWFGKVKYREEYYMFYSWVAGPGNAYWRTHDEAMKIMRQHEDDQVKAVRRLKALEGRP